MQGHSLTQEMLKPGTTVMVEGYPSTQKQRGIALSGSSSPAGLLNCADEPENCVRPASWFAWG
jgi:hypothetical protein